MKRDEGEGSGMQSKSTCLLTGASGFIGSHVLTYLLGQTDAHVITPVSFRHSGDPDRLSRVFTEKPEWRARTTVLLQDLTTPFSRVAAARLANVDSVINIASESHVDRSIAQPVKFTENNVAIVLNMLELARIIQPKSFIQLSTDEVYGAGLGSDGHTEWSTILPSNPYAASKAAQEAICISYWKTFNVPITIVNSPNIIGEMQNPEKFVPKTIGSLYGSRTATVHLADDGTPGSRSYLYAQDLASALLFIESNVPSVTPAQHSRPNRFQLVGAEIDNVNMVNLIAEAMQLTEFSMVRVAAKSVRPGYDERYTSASSRLEGLGWKGPGDIRQAITRVVKWTLSNKEWMAA